MMPKLINMARLVLALLALTAVNAGHCAGGGLENYCCMVACDSSYGTHPGDPNCGGAAASVTRMSDIYAIAGAGGCAPLSPGECSFGVPQETTCTAQLGFDPRTKIGATANTIAAALGNPTPPPAPPATFSPTTAPPTAYPTFSDAFIASKTADGKANAKSGHALYRVGSHTAALPKYVSAHSDFKSILGDGSLLAQGMKHRASIVGVLTGLAPLTGLDNSYPSGSELNVHQGGVEECGTSNIASFANGVISGAVTHKRNLATSKVTCNPGFIGTPSIQCAPIASGGATRGTSEGESGYQWVSVGSCDADPWYNTGWASTATGTSSGTVATTQSASVTGHLVIVHNTAGAKVGCGPLILNTAGENVAAITTIPGYTGSLTVGGTFTFVQAGSQLDGVYTLTGLPALTTGSFHVHAGTSCAAVGGHFATASTENPTPGHVHYPTLGYGVKVGMTAPPASLVYDSNDGAATKLGSLGLSSPDGKVRFNVQSDGNMVVSQVHATNSGVGNILWPSGTAGNPGAYLQLQQDGNLVLYDQNGGVHWKTDTTNGVRLEMQDDCNLVLYDSNGGAPWSSNTQCV